MAKDGTNRGGRRPKSGKKSAKKAENLTLFDGVTNLGHLVSKEEMEGVEIPDASAYLKAKQKNGKDFQAEEIYKQTYVWLKKRNCEKIVSKQLIEQYAMSVARFIQCEDAISEYGFLSKHPTTGNAQQSPFVSMSQMYMKQINATWYQIYIIVKENGGTNVEELDEQDKMMERLLNSKQH